METRNRGDFLAKMSHVYELSSIFLDKEVDYMLLWNHPSQYCLYEIEVQLWTLQEMMVGIHQETKRGSNHNKHLANNSTSTVFFYPCRAMVNIYLIPCPQPIMDNQIHNPNRLMPVRGQAEIFLLILDYKVDKKSY